MNSQSCPFHARWQEPSRKEGFLIMPRLVSAAKISRMPPMIIRASNAFPKRFKCQLSHEGTSIPQEKRLDAWSCHYVRVGRKPLVVVMNDATLYTFIFPVTGVKDFAEFWTSLLGRIAETWMRFGADFDPQNQSVIVLPRANRSLIGSMNDAVKLIRLYDECARCDGVELDLLEMEQRSNETPYKSIGFIQPKGLLSIRLMMAKENE